MPPIQRGVTNDTRRKNRRDFVSVFISSALMTAVVVIIWAVTGASAFWPIWVIFGLSVVLVASAWRAFSPQHSGKHNDPDRPLDRQQTDQPQKKQQHGRRHGI